MLREMRETRTKAKKARSVARKATKESVTKTVGVIKTVLTGVSVTRNKKRVS
jgi:hypothetical protein